MIGFEYGLCKNVDVAGGISEIAFDYLPNKGIHRLRITNNHPDGAVTHEFGGSGSTLEDDPSIQSAKLAFGGEGSRRLLGFKGRWKNSGLTGFGMIFLDESCIPKSTESGEQAIFIENKPEPVPEPKEPEKEIVYVDRIVEVEV